MKQIIKAKSVIYNSHKLLYRVHCKYVIIITVLCALLCGPYFLKGKELHVNLKNYFAGDIVDFSYANNISGFAHFIVPNIVHFVHFDKKDLSFIQVINIKAVNINHQPEKIYIHCNCYSLNGKYWDMVKDISIIEIIYMQKPTHIFEKPLSSVYHSSDIARIQVLMKYGGIFLDTDTYVVKSLNYFRRYEMAIGWHPGQYLGTQLLVAHKNARFLQYWYNSYHYYRPELWYYNAGELPTKLFLERMPYLVHRVPYDFGVHMLVHLLYGTRSSDWRNYHGIHLLVRHKHYLVPGDTVTEFNEDNIKTYNKTFGDMARLVLYGSTDFV